MAAYLAAHLRAAISGREQSIATLKPKRIKKHDPTRPVRSAQAELRKIRQDFAALERGGAPTLEL